jgi:hypothetical protein
LGAGCEGHVSRGIIGSQPSHCRVSRTKVGIGPV